MWLFFISCEDSSVRPPSAKRFIEFGVSELRLEQFCERQSLEAKCGIAVKSERTREALSASSPFYFVEPRLFSPVLDLLHARTVSLMNLRFK